MLAMDPGNVLPEVSCQVIVLVVGTCSSKNPAKRLLLINEDESWTTFMVAVLHGASRWGYGKCCEIKARKR